MRIGRSLGLVFLLILTVGIIQGCSHRWHDWDDQCYGHGGGMMWHGGGCGPGMMGSGPGYYRSGEPLTIDQAKSTVERYIAFSRNPNIKVGQVTEKDKYFEAEIITKEGSIVDKLMIDKQTGWMRSVY
ncbi:MAG: hypothetical protein ABSA71_09360 [Desulfomonilia bacterium]|jgi:hypothetical protein